MRILILPILLLAAQPARGQDAPRWRLGIALTSPAKILEVNSNELPDSNASHVDLGPGFGVEATRLWWASARGAFGVFARASLARTNVTVGGGDFSPGWAVIGEAGASLRRQITHSFGLKLGAGLSHWSGPDDTAPFSAIGSILATGEGGFTVRLKPGLNADIIANATRIGAQDDRGISGGFVWRFILGIHHEQ